jgi:hypothetical protein
MTRQFSNPFAIVGGVELQRQFGDLLSVRAKMSDLEYGLVASMLANMFELQLSVEDRKRWEQTVRAAHYYLEVGRLKALAQFADHTRESMISSLALSTKSFANVSLIVVASCERQ